MAETKMAINSAYDEYQYFLSEYLLPLMGVSFNKNLVRVSSSERYHAVSSSPFIRQEGDTVIFSSYNEDVFRLEWLPTLAKESIALARVVIPAFFNASKYWISDNQQSVKMDYKTDAIRDENYRLAIQKGICDWCAGRDNEYFYHLIQILEQWSVQTYEGNKVTFGFVYNPRAKPLFCEDGYGTWLDFMKDDYAATLTDCIHSVIELDKNCNFAGFLSATENDEVDAYRLTPFLPYRFARIIEKYVTGSKVGVFLLHNGDILISKNRSVQLIKRNLKWLNLSFNTFLNMVQSKMKRPLSEELVMQIYASTLDVSFAHTGGIIAAVSDISQLTATETPVLNVCDNLLDKRSLSEIDAEMSTSNLYTPMEIHKRLLKRKVIFSLVNGRKFAVLDRKLRTELISMDGACILNFDGDICAAGAIIRNDSGSSGGGRSAAAKKLSTYNGLAVKISTDGYIELYIDYEPVYAIK